MKLVQKSLIKGVREFEIADGFISVNIKSRFKEEKLTIVLSVINPNPVVNGSHLEFFSRVKADDVLFSLLLDKPNADEFNAFVSALRRRASEEFGAFTGLRGVEVGVDQGGTVDDFDTAPAYPRQHQPKLQLRPANPERLDDSIRMLEQFMDADEISPLIAALSALKSRPDDASAIDQLAVAFAGLGMRQGAVLTYAPYVGILLSESPPDQG